MKTSASTSSIIEASGLQRLVKRHPLFCCQPASMAAALAMLWLGALAPSVRGQSSYTWNGGGGDGNFGTGGNWGGTAPSSLQAFLNFAGSTRLNPNDNYSDYSGGFQIYFNSGAGAFTISGSHIKFYNYGGSGVNGDRPNIQNDSSSLQTINFGFGSESAGYNLDINANSGDMAFGASSGNAFSYFDDAGVYLAVHANNNHTVTFWGPIGNGSQNAKFSLDGGGACVFNAANTYAGETDLNAGELRIGSSGGISSSSAIWLGNGATLTTTAQLTLALVGGGQTFANNFTVNNSSGGQYRVIASANTTGNNTYSGSITLNGDANLTAQNSGGQLTFSGQITTTGSKFVAATGPGTVVLSGSGDNSSTGLNANGGTVVLGKTSSSSVHAIGNNLNVNSGGTARLGGSGGDQISDGASVAVNSGGVFDLNGQNETFITLTINGTGISSGGALINPSFAKGGQKRAVSSGSGSRNP